MKLHGNLWGLNSKKNSAHFQKLYQEPFVNCLFSINYYSIGFFERHNDLNNTKCQNPRS